MLAHLTMKFWSLHWTGMFNIVLSWHNPDIETPYVLHVSTYCGHHQVHRAFTITLHSLRYTSLHRHTKTTHHIPVGQYTVTDLLKALPGNSSVNTVQQATMGEPVFSMWWLHATMEEAVFSMRWRHQQYGNYVFCVVRVAAIQRVSL
jgi:hypothetical protein